MNDNQQTKNRGFNGSKLFISYIKPFRKIFYNTNYIMELTPEEQQKKYNNEYHYIIRLHLNKNLDILDKPETREERHEREYGYLFLIGIPYLLKVIREIKKRGTKKYNEKDFLLVFLSLYIEYTDEIMDYYDIGEDEANECEFIQIKISKKENEYIKEQFKQYKKEDRRKKKEAKKQIKI
jgi:hypothetical protein